MYEGRRGRGLRGERKNEEGDVVGGVNGKKTLRFFLEKKNLRSFFLRSCMHGGRRGRGLRDERKKNFAIFFVCDLFFFCVRVCTKEEEAVV